MNCYIKLLVTLVAYTLVEQLPAISVVTPSYDNISTMRNEGYFPEIYIAILPGRTTQFPLITLPQKRALRHFIEGNSKCFLGGDPKLIEKYLGKLDLISSNPLLKNRYVISTLRTEPVIESVKELKKKALGFVIGDEPMVKGIQAQAIFSSEIEGLIGMMLRGRVQAVVHWYPLTKKFERDIHHDPKFYLSEMKDRINCYRSDESLKFIELVNRGIADAKKHGWFQAIQKKYFGPRLIQ